MNALTTAGNGAEKPSSQSARNVAHRSPLRRTLLFAGVFALLAMVYVPMPMYDHGHYKGGGYRFIFDQSNTGIAFFQLLVNVAFAALAGVLVAHAFRAIAKIPKRVIVVAASCIIAVVAGFALTVNYYRLKADSERQRGLYLYAAADYDHALFFGDLAGQCRREQAQMMERARLHGFYISTDPNFGLNKQIQQGQAAAPAIDLSGLPDQSPTSPIPDWAQSPPDWVKSASKKSDDTQEKK